MSKKLKTAVLGLNERGRVLLEAAHQSGLLQIDAIADKNTALAEKLAEQYKCAAYDDYRQLIIQNHFDCLLVAANIHTCDEYIKTAIKRKSNILKLTPPARGFEEATEFTRLAEEHNVKFAVANTCRFMQSYQKLHQRLQQHNTKQIFLITAVCTAVNKEKPKWQVDPKSAGGGVLLHDCYEIIDQITWNLSVPQQIFALNTNIAQDRQQRLHSTEDIAVVSLKFSDISFGNIVANRICGQQQQFLKIHIGDNIITVCEKKFQLEDENGNIIEQYDFDDNLASSMCKLLENFAQCILSPDENKLDNSIKNNLKNMAVIESAYLSARTTMPEEPQKILQMELNQPTNIWPTDK